MYRRLASRLLYLMALVALAPLAAHAGDPPQSDVATLGDRLLDASEESVDSLARAVAALDLGDARALVQQLRTRFAKVDSQQATPRAWPRLTPLEVGDDEQARTAVDPDTPIVDVTTRVIEVPAALVPRLLALGNAAEGATTVWLDRDGSERLEALLAAADSQANTLTAPRLATYDGQRATISVLNQISYIQDYEVEVAQDEFIADPTLGVLNEGFVLDLRPTVSADRAHVTLELGITEAEVARPIASIQVPAGPSTVTLQVPEMHVRQMRCTVKLPTGGQALLVGEAKTPEGGGPTRRIVLVGASLTR